MKFKPFRRVIFFGNSNRAGNGPTDRDIEELNRQIKQLQSIISGLQQPCHHATKKEALQCTRERNRIFKVKWALSESIARALDIL